MKTSTPERLVVIAPNWLGDAVMALPVIEHLRRAWPRMCLAVAARASVAPLFGMVPGVDQVVALGGGGGVASLRSAAENARTLRAGRFDAALLLPNSFLSAWMVWRAGVSERWGFRSDWRGRLLTRAIPRPRKLVHQAEYYLTLAAGLGMNGSAPPTDAAARTARVRVPDDAHARAMALLAAAGLRDHDSFVAFAPGAAYGGAKQWPPEHFVELGDVLRRERGLRTVLIGARADAAVCRRIADAVPQAIDLSARTDLPVLAGVLRAAQAVVTNDSGAMHLAAAVGAPVVAIFGATNEQKSAPLRGGAGAPAPAIVATDVWCRPCMLRECPIDHRCMTRIGADEVLAAVVSSLRS